VLRYAVKEALGNAEECMRARKQMVAGYCDIHSVSPLWPNLNYISGLAHKDNAPLLRHPTPGVNTVSGYTLCDVSATRDKPQHIYIFALYLPGYALQM
jgi:hypothetical protein